MAYKKGILQTLNEKYGLVRVFTDKQNEERQILAMLDYGLQKKI